MTLIIGGGVAGLTAAYELASRGAEVTVIEAQSELGGMIRGIDLGGITVDSGAEAYATRTPVVHDLCTRLGLDVAAPEGRSHIWWSDPPRRHPLARGILGIPASLDDDAVRLGLTAEQRQRAARDLEMPVGELGSTVAEIVRERLDDGALDRLVSPLTRSIYRMDPAQMPIERFAPGLVDAVVSHGSLVRAVAALTTDRATVEQPIGGMHRLVEALAESVRAAGGTIRTSVRADSLAPVADADADAWEVATSDGAYQAARVIVAVPAAVAAALLTPVGVEFTPPPVRTARNLLLSLRHPALDANPVGAGIIVAETTGELSATALTHYSAKWPWARRHGLHVIRLSIPADADPDLDVARAEASALLGIDLGPENVVAHHVATWNEMPSALDEASRARLRDQLSTRPGIAVAGAWFAGNGIGAVVESALEAAA